MVKMIFAQKLFFWVPQGSFIGSLLLIIFTCELLMTNRPSVLPTPVATRYLEKKIKKKKINWHEFSKMSNE